MPVFQIRNIILHTALLLAVGEHSSSSISTPTLGAVGLFFFFLMSLFSYRWYRIQDGTKTEEHTGKTLGWVHSDLTAKVEMAE